MKSESLAYKLQPAGHEASNAKRKYASPDKKLELAFEKFLKKTYRVNPDKYGEFAKELLKNVQASVDEAHALVVKYQEHPDIRDAGNFISAIYNKAPEKTIVYEFDIPIDFLAHKLAKDKIFVNKGYGGFYVGGASRGIIVNQNLTCGTFGFEAQGPVINYGKSGNNVGTGSSGLLLNQGEMEDQVAMKNSGVAINQGKISGIYGLLSTGMIINQGVANSSCGYLSTGIVLLLRKPKRVDRTERMQLLLRPADCKKMPELENYLNNLKQNFASGKDDYRKVLSVLDDLGPAPHDRIKKDIEGILKKYDNFPYTK